MTIMVIVEVRMANWAVAEAKAKFSAVLDRAEDEGPQLVERRKRQFVLMTVEELARRTQLKTPLNVHTSKEPSGKKLWEALRCAPEDGIDVEFPRLKWKSRKVEF